MRRSRQMPPCWQPRIHAHTRCAIGTCTRYRRDITCVASVGGGASARVDSNSGGTSDDTFAVEIVSSLTSGHELRFVFALRLDHLLHLSSKLCTRDMPNVCIVCFVSDWCMAVREDGFESFVRNSLIATGQPGHLTPAKSPKMQIRKNALAPLGLFPPPYQKSKHIA